MTIRILAVCALLGTLAACTSSRTSERAAETRPTGAGSVEVSVEGVESQEGLVYGSIYLSTDGFPEEKSLAYTYQSAPATAANDGSLVLRFPSVPAGWFVVAILHDEDGDEELSVNPLGIPKEKYGFSLNPDSLFGPPPFDAAAVYLQPDESKRLVVTLE